MTTKPIQPATPRRNYTAPLESDRCDAQAVTALGGEGCRCMRRKIKGANVCSVHACNDYPRLLADNERLRKANDEFSKEHSRLATERAELVAALRSFLDASDQFVRDTGLKHGDLITERAEDARKVLRKLGVK